jgi:hypothetical protein
MGIAQDAGDLMMVAAMMKMKTAWVITHEGTQHPTEAIGVLSARKSSREIKTFVEWLYALLSYYPGEHLRIAHYTKPLVLYEAQFFTTNTGVPVDSGQTCGHNPFLVACRAKNLVLVGEDGDKQVLKWTGPDQLVCDLQTLHVIERIPGKEREAPIRLPLRLME